ncbi:hypothetical protein SAY87_021587 [Trapa incisa]|uniref:tRNA (adenine(58)-N(1))-methyltransferase non-catalytic subunit TRM6 n=1 Tax=Trapa incisa TaxID=236973 RepID=A0AAN7JTG0_9MYRT|nr:hypothetical protein SAY87_021587 [Trapa incisa]
MSENKPRVDPVQDQRVTWEGCSVLLDINDGDRLVFARLNQGSTLKIGNKTYSLKPLVGCPFGSLFQVDNGPKGSVLWRVTLPSQEGNHVQGKGSSESQESRDNRALVDNNQAQTLTGDDIEALRKEGATGEEIIEALIANSSTFEKKTTFSQEKYRIKKQKKYAPRVLVRKPVTRTICEAYFKKYPNRTGCLRVDALSLLLSMGNVAAHSDILVVDMVGGLLTGAVAERLGGSGYVCNTQIGAKPYSMDIVRMFNFNDDICTRIVRSSLNDFYSVEKNMPEESNNGSNVCNADTQHCQSEEIPHEDSISENADVKIPPSEIEMVDATCEIRSSPVLKTCKSAKAGEKASEEMIRTWRENGFSSLIVAAPELDICKVVKDLVPLLAYSAPFAIYHQYLQPLATCMHYLQIEKMAIGLQISEPWLREYQVLPSRTHPFMQMSAFGGYILSGTRICNPLTSPQEKQ